MFVCLSGCLSACLLVCMPLCRPACLQTTHTHTHTQTHKRTHMHTYRPLCADKNVSALRLSPASCVARRAQRTAPSSGRTRTTSGGGRGRGSCAWPERSSCGSSRATGACCAPWLSASSVTLKKPLAHVSARARARRTRTRTHTTQAQRQKCESDKTRTDKARYDIGKRREVNSEQRRGEENRGGKRNVKRQYKEREKGHPIPTCATIGINPNAYLFDMM